MVRWARGARAWRRRTAGPGVLGEEKGKGGLSARGERREGGERKRKKRKRNRKKKKKRREEKEKGERERDSRRRRGAWSATRGAGHAWAQCAGQG